LRFCFETEDEVLAAAEHLAAQRLHRFQRASDVFAAEAAAARPGDDATLPGTTAPPAAKSPTAGFESEQRTREPTPLRGNMSSKRTRFGCAICGSAATFSDPVAAVRTSAEGRAADVDAEQLLCTGCSEPRGTRLA
jgi:hypothetical protein